MKLNILAILSPPNMPFVEEMEPTLRPYCTLTLLEARSNQQARELFEAHGLLYDAVVFSGRIFMVSATRNRYDTIVPCFVFEDLVSDLPDSLYQILLRDRSFDFSRVSIDMIVPPGDPMGMRRLFPKDQQPHYLDASAAPLFSFDEVTVELLTQKVLAWHLELFRAGKTSHIITRFGAIIEELSATGIPVTYMRPSRDYTINFFMQIVGSLSMKYAEDQVLAVIALRCLVEDSTVNDRLLTQCGNAIAEIGRLRGYDFAFSLNTGKLEILTRHKVLAEVTDNFTTVPFVSQVPEEVRENIYMGLGTGNTLFQAQSNAASALSASGTSRKVHYVSHQGQMIGPLGQGQGAFQAMPDDHLIALSARYGVDHVVLQQLLAYTRVAGRNVMTAQELAQFMAVSRRTANRILTKITEKGGARIYAENASGGKGRPKIQYQLLFS